MGVTREDTAVSLLNMPPEDDWILLNNYNDKSFVRNPLMHELFRDMGHYSPRNQFCEVFINGEYRGIYTLMEKIRRTNDRLNISKLKSSDNSGDDLTGGYIFRHDYDLGEGWLSTVAPADCPENFARFEYEYPSVNNITPQQKTYLQNYVAEIERRMFSPLVNDPIMGYRPMLDVHSFIDYFIVNELAWNGDGFAKSMFFWKDKNSKDSLLHAGPVWDFDWSMKRMPWVTDAVDHWNHNTYPCNNLQSTLPWHAIMMQDTFFTNELRCRWESLRKTHLSESQLFRSIDSIGQQTLEAQVRHFQKWPTWGINVATPEKPPFAKNYAEEIDTLKALLTRRMMWLDATIPGTCPKLQEPPAPLPDTTIPPPIVYPNPATRAFTVYSEKTPIHSVILLHHSGRRIEEKHFDPPVYELQMSPEHIVPGLYFLRIHTETGVFNQRILLQKPLE